MPNVYTSDDPKRIEQQVTAIQRCLGLLDARIMLLEQELQELNTNGDSFIREYLDLYIFPMLEADEETKSAAYDSCGTILENDKYWCNDDLKRLKQLKLYLLDMLAGTDDGLLFALQIQVNIHGCENGRTITERNSRALQKNAEAAYEHTRRQNGNNKNALAVRAAARHTAKVVNKAKFDIKYFEKTTQLYLYEQVLRILKSNVFNDIEIDLPRFFSFTPGLGANIDIGLKSYFTQLEDRNKKLLKDTQTKLVANHQDAIAQFPEHKEELALDLRLLITASGICKKFEFSSQKSLIDFYRNHYTCASNLTAYIASDSELLTENLELLQKQAEITKAEAEAAQAAKERAAAEVVQAAAEEIAIAEEIRRITIQTEKATKEQLRLEHVRKQQLRAIEKDEKAKAKIKRHQDAVKQSEKFIPTETRKEKVLAVTEAVVLANVAELRELFTGTRYRFSKLPSLAKALGGELINNSRSRHAHICFNQLYEFEVWQGANDAPVAAASTSVKGSVSDPHGQGRDSFIRSYNLYLARSAVESVMPPNYLELLDINFKPKERVALRASHD